MISLLRRLLRRSKAPAQDPRPVEEKLEAAARAQALSEAQRLFRTGVWVRPLREGEEPSDIPEVSETPYREKDGRLITSGD